MMTPMVVVPTHQCARFDAAPVLIGEHVLGVHHHAVHVILPTPPPHVSQAWSE